MGQDKSKDVQGQPMSEDSSTLKFHLDKGLSDKPLVLIGLSGAGKSSIGARLAKRLGTSFVDMDVLIEERIGQTISSFFEQYGEAAFRDMEQDVLQEVLIQNYGVIATGGGTIVREQSREALKEKARVIYLDATIEELHNRLRNDNTRPMLKGADLVERLRLLSSQRDHLYKECAHFIVNSCNQHMDALVESLVCNLNLKAA